MDNDDRGCPDACDAQERSKGLCCAYHRSLFLSEVSDAFHHSSFNEKDDLVLAATAVRDILWDVDYQKVGEHDDSGFEILSIEWANETEFTIEMKLIDEDDIYTGYCSSVLKSRPRQIVSGRTNFTPRTTKVTMGGKKVLRREEP
jgi:hypothetical protein